MKVNETYDFIQFFTTHNQKHINTLDGQYMGKEANRDTVLSIFSISFR